MIDAKTRDSLSRNDLVSFHLRRLALIADPANGQLLKLADDIGVHPTTLSNWIAQGCVPWFQCLKIQRRFRRFVSITDLDELCPEDCRQA